MFFSELTNFPTAPVYPGVALIIAGNSFWIKGLTLEKTHSLNLVNQVIAKLLS